MVTPSPLLGPQRGKIWTAACPRPAPPPRPRTATTSTPDDGALHRVQTFYASLDPAAATNGPPARLANKLTYSAANTCVYLTFQDRPLGPPQSTETYNPSSHPDISLPPLRGGLVGPRTGFIDPSRTLPGSLPSRP